MRTNTNTSTGSSRIPSTTRGGTTAGALPSRTRATPTITTTTATRSAITSTRPADGGLRPGVSSAAATSTAARPTASRVVNGARGPTSTAVGNPARRAPAQRSRLTAVQEEMDLLADDFFGKASVSAPMKAASGAASSADSFYCRTMATHDVTAATLQSHTTWFDGPLNKEGRSFDASDSNLLCMDVLVPSPTASSASASSLCVVGSADHGLKVFDLNSMREVKSLYTKTCGHTDWVTSCRFLSDRRVLSGGMDAKLCLWADVSRGGPARCVDLLGHTGSVSQVDVSEHHGRALAMSASYDRTIRLWELSGSAAGGGRQVGCLAGHKGPVTQFSWREAQVLSGDRQGTVKLWDVETAQCGLTASSKRGQIGALGHLVHPDVGHLAMFGDQGGVVTVLDARAPPKSKPVFQEELHPGGMVTFLRAPSAAAVAAPLMLTGGADKRITARDARQNFAEVYTLRDHDDFVYSMEILGNLLLTGAGNGRVLVHNVETGELLYELDGNAAAVREIFASPGKLVTSGDDGKAKVFDFM